MAGEAVNTASREAGAGTTSRENRKGPEPGNNAPDSGQKDRQAGLRRQFASKIRGMFRPEVTPESVLEKIGKEPKADNLPRERTKRFLRRDKLTPSDITSATSDEQLPGVKANKAELLASVTGKVSPRKEKAFYIQAVRKSQAEAAKPGIDQANKHRSELLQQIDTTRSSTLFQDVLKDEIDRRALENGGKPPGRREQIRMERDLLTKAVKGEPITAEAKLAAEAEDTIRAEAQKRERKATEDNKVKQEEEAKAKEAETAKLKSRSDYGEAYAAALKDLAPEGLTSDGKPMSGEQIRALTATAEHKQLMLRE